MTRRISGTVSFDWFDFESLDSGVHQSVAEASAAIFAP
jgi:hypothetical protein